MAMMTMIRDGDDDVLPVVLMEKRKDSRHEWQLLVLVSLERHGENDVS